MGDWPSVLAAMGNSDGATDLMISSQGRVRMKYGGSYISPSIAPELLSDGWWTKVCETIHPAAPGMLDGEFSRDGGVKIGNVRLRVSRVRHYHGEEFTLRILPASAPAPNKLLLPESLVSRFMGIPNGLVVFAGAAGNGKTTSIASLVSAYAQKKAVRVITIEDPVEYLHPDMANGSTFTYREIGHHCEGYTDALRDALRMHPDFILVGEIRTAEAAQIALDAALSGHKVVATIHGGDVEQAVRRLGDMAADIGSSGIGALAQALRLCVAQELVPTGTLGKRVPVHEILGATDSVRMKIREGRFGALRQDMEGGSRDGMQTFAQSRQAREHEGLLLKAS